MRQLVADLTDRPIAEVAQALGALVAPRTQEVVVLWPGDGRAARMPVSDLLGDLSGLWRPGEDDSSLRSRLAGGSSCSTTSRNSGASMTDPSLELGPRAGGEAR